MISSEESSVLVLYIKFDPKNRSNAIDAATEISFIFLVLKFINFPFLCIVFSMMLFSTFSK